MRRCDTARHGFTLVEMLVVIAVIVLLASLLLPTLRNARESGRVVACMSNQRNLHASMAMFAEGNRGWAPGNDYNTCAGMGQGVYTNGQRCGTSLMLSRKFIKDWRVFLCPSAEGFRGPTWLYRHGWNYEYRYNIHYGGVKLGSNYASLDPFFADHPDVGVKDWPDYGPPYGVAAKIVTAQDPTLSVLLTDGVHFADYHDHSAIGVGGENVGAETWLVVTASHTGHTMLNATYIDGHTIRGKAYQSPGGALPMDPWFYACFPTYLDPWVTF